MKPTLKLSHTTPAPLLPFNQWAMYIKKELNRSLGIKKINKK